MHDSIVDQFNWVEDTKTNHEFFRELELWIGIHVSKNVVKFQDVNWFADGKNQSVKISRIWQF